MLVEVAALIAVFGLRADTSVEDVRKAHMAALNALETCHVAYKSEMSAAHASAESAALIASRFQHDPEQGKQAIREMELNTTTGNDQVEVYFDARAAEWKVSSTDKRDLNQIIAKENLPEWRRNTLDRSCVRLTGRNLEADFYPATNKLFIDESAVKSLGGSLALSTPLRFGVVPEGFFQNLQHSSIQPVSVENRSMVRLSLDSKVLEVDPKLALHCRSLKLYSAEGRLTRDERFDDYRVVDGFPFPFKYERSDFDQEGTVARHTTVVVTSAEFNHPLPPDAFLLVFVRDVQLIGVQHHYNGSIPAGRSLELGQLQSMIQADPSASMPDSR